MFATQEEQNKYIRENYPEITDSRVDDAHWDILCSKCGVTRGFVVTEMGFAHQQTRYSGISLNQPHGFSFHCPVCKLYKLWIVFEISGNETKEDGSQEWIKRYYKVTSLPSEGLEEIEQLPKDPPSLRIAYRQAIRAMDANAHIAAAAMFRRALQIITRDILGAKHGSLADELDSLVGTEFNGVKLTNNFATNGYIVRESGNQGAHPDRDPDLLDFTQQDAEDLQGIFMELVSELFIAPEAMRKAKQEFMQRRKISPPQNS